LESSEEGKEPWGFVEKTDSSELGASGGHGYGHATTASKLCAVEWTKPRGILRSARGRGASAERKMAESGRGKGGSQRS